MLIQHYRQLSDWSWQQSQFVWWHRDASIGWNPSLRCLAYFTNHCLNSWANFRSFTLFFNHPFQHWPCNLYLHIPKVFSETQDLKDLMEFIWSIQKRMLPWAYSSWYARMARSHVTASTWKNGQTRAGVSILNRCVSKRVTGLLQSRVLVDALPRTGYRGLFHWLQENKEQCSVQPGCLKVPRHLFHCSSMTE